MVRLLLTAVRDPLLVNGISLATPFAAYLLGEEQPATRTGAAARTGATGSRPLIVVPWPGRDRTSSAPPCAASRSVMPCIPDPDRGPPAGRPVPSSPIENSRLSPFPDSRITARVARACLATFCSASSAQK